VIVSNHEGLCGELPKVLGLSSVTVQSSGSLALQHRSSRGGESMKRVIPLLLAFLLIASPAFSQASYDPSRHYELWIFDVVYRRDGNESWLMRVYQPQGSGPFPVLLDVHYGVWTLADRTANAPVDRVLAASGLVVAAIDFHQAPKYPYPTSVADVNYATRWLKIHARDFAGDARKLGAFGSSSGGHLVMLSAMRPHDQRYAGVPLATSSPVDASLAYVIALSPILDPYARYLFAKETGRDDLIKMTDGYFPNQRQMQEGNPTMLLLRGEKAQLPPTLIIQGTADKNVTPAMQQRFATAYRAAGGTVDLEIFPDAPHIFALSPGPDSERSLSLMKTFIVRQLR